MIITRDYKIMTTVLYFVHSFCSPSGDPQISPVVAAEIQICPSGREEGQTDSGNLNMHNLGVMSHIQLPSLVRPTLCTLVTPVILSQLYLPLCMGLCSNKKSLYFLATIGQPKGPPPPPQKKTLKTAKHRPKTGFSR